MADQSITISMHTLNKYGVPCTDVTDYSDVGGGGTAFYLQKNKYKYIVRTKIKVIELPEPPELTGIPGYVYCFFRNDLNEEKGYCDYYSLHSGQLVKTVELPFMIGGESILEPVVDINSTHVVYSAIEYVGDITKYNRFTRDIYGELALTGRVLLEQSYYKNSVVYLNGSNTYTGQPNIPPRDIPPSDFDIENNTITLVNHGFTNEMSEWIRFSGVGNPPAPLSWGVDYVVIDVIGDTFKLATNPFVGPFTGIPIDITTLPTYDVLLTVDWGYYAYDDMRLIYEISAIRPSNIHLDRLYINRLGEDTQTGRFYYEVLPDLSATYDRKRVALGYHNLFVGNLGIGTEYVIQVPFSTLLPSGYPDAAAYTMPINVFNDSVDDGSGDYVVGSGQIKGHWLNDTLMICTSYDDVRGSSGNQAYEKWYNSSGSYLYTWTYPSYLWEGVEEFYVIYPRINYSTSFYYFLVHPRTGIAYLYHYNLLTGQLAFATELVNPTLAEDGLAYRLTNRQLIDGKYLMLHTSSSHHVFFDVSNLQAGIRGQITMEGVADEYGFFVVPEIQV